MDLKNKMTKLKILINTFNIRVNWTEESMSLKKGQLSCAPFSQPAWQIESAIKLCSWMWEIKKRKVIWNYSQKDKMKNKNEGQQDSWDTI
jgi:hypothetical protein